MIKQLVIASILFYFSFFVLLYVLACFDWHVSLGINFLINSHGLLANQANTVFPYLSEKIFQFPTAVILWGNIKLHFLRVFLYPVTMLVVHMVCNWPLGWTLDMPGLTCGCNVRNTQFSTSSNLWRLLLSVSYFISYPDGQCLGAAGAPKKDCAPFLWQPALTKISESLCCMCICACCVWICVWVCIVENTHFWPMN